RLEGFDYDHKNRKDRLRERVRARWGLEKEFNDEWKAGFRISTGPADEAVSTNQSLDDEFGLKQLYLNRAYGIWTPTQRFRQFIPATELVEIGAGKVENPYSSWGTSLVWDGDVEPEGIYEALDFKLADVGEKGSWTLNTLLGQWILEEQSTKKDIGMQSYGIGTTVVSGDKSQKYVVKYAFYDWQDYDSVLRGGLSNTEIDNIDASYLTGTTPAGNDLQTDAFKIHSIYLEAGFKDVNTGLFGPQPIKLFGQFLHNAEEGSQVTNTGQDDAWTLGVQVGKAKDQGTGQFKYQYYEIEQNSTVGNFSESDLGGGGTNKEGHKFEFKYQILKNVQLAWTNWLVDDIINTSTTDREVWRTQLDTIFKF
ncbi:MAG: putative porin, partial [Candidatus Omnitrophica bacterium]|nr:putative porin [Candidatus Omnitrophota bacterium]